MASNSDIDKILAFSAHLGGIFFSFIPSLLVFLLRKDQPGWVLENAREALNWQITMLIVYAVAWVLSLVLVGFLIMGLAHVLNIIFCLIATVKAAGREAWRYPFCLRLLN